MKLTLVSFRMTVAYGVMTLFIAIPIVKTLLGSPFTIIELGVSYAIAVSFGLYATHELEIYDKVKKPQNIIEATKEFRSDEYKDSVRKEKCPKCGEAINEISYRDGKKQFYGKYKGLVYCSVCDFEEPIEEFERRFM